MADDEQIETQEREHRVGLIIGGIAVAALLIFIFQNTADTQLKFLWMDRMVPTYLLILITVVLTLVISVITAWILNRRSKR